MADSWFNYDPAIGGTYSNTVETRKAGSNLDRDAFLKLLITQMQYQDPLNPMDNSQMLAQMAQFSALEQMQNVASTTMQSMAFSMIGKMVEGLVENSSGGNDTVMGVVQSILVQNGKTYLTVGDKLLQVDKVTNVYTDPVTTISNNIATNQSFNMIGKVVQAITVDSSYNPTGFVEGKVDYVKFTSDGGTILVVGDKEIFPQEVVSVGADNMLINKEIAVEEKNEEGVYELVRYPVTDVVIRDGKAYLKAGGKEIFVEKINYATDSLALVGEEITFSGITGVVDNVIIRDGVPYLRIGTTEISFKAYRNIADEEKVTE